MAGWPASSRVATVALVGLLALDVALVAMALKSTSASPADTGVGTSASPSLDHGSAPSATTSGSEGRSSPAIATAVPLQTMIVAVDDQQAWRAGSGSCPDGGGKLLSTVDGGKSWTKGKADFRRILRVQPADGGAAFVIGANSGCAAELKDTSDGGLTWAGGGNVGRAWFRDPSNPMVVRAPGPATSAPCGKRPVLDLAVLKSGSARVLCGDGVVRSTKDSSSGWTVMGTVDGAVALAVSTASASENYVARLGAPDCAGVQIVQVRQGTSMSCVRTSTPKGAGQIALSLVEGGGWLAVGDLTMRSTDDLRTWKVSSRGL
jgi:hypothetical protein